MTTVFMQPVKAYLGLGSNLGNRKENLESALRELSSHRSLLLEACSRFYLGAPVEMTEVAPGMFLNAVCRVLCWLPPGSLLRACHELEANFGRQRAPGRVMSRYLDVDILAYGDMVSDDLQLRVPHPDLWRRDFVYMPMLEVLEPNWTDPRTGLSAWQRMTWLSY